MPRHQPCSRFQDVNEFSPVMSLQWYALNVFSFMMQIYWILSKSWTSLEGGEYSCTDLFRPPHTIVSLSNGLQCRRPCSYLKSCAEQKRASTFEAVLIDCLPYPGPRTSCRTLTRKMELEEQIFYVKMKKTGKRTKKGGRHGWKREVKLQWITMQRVAGSRK